MGRGSFDRFHEDMKSVGGDIRKVVKINSRKQNIDNKKYFRYCVLMLLIITLLLSGVKIMPTIMIGVLISILELTGN